MNYVNYKAREIGQEILGGNVEVNPFAYQKESACDYCPYRNVCGFDEKIPGYSYRRLGTCKPEEIWEKMKAAEQQKVIDTRDCNILVSAAAGSGKTAVLVERILERILDKNRPVDIDRLLVVTFTRAAAGEMKERIARAIEKRLEEDSENEHLQRQSTLVHHAQITTIDSFCAYVVKNYFHLIDLDPSFRMGDEGEMRLMRGDVAEKILEEAYGREDYEDPMRILKTWY